MHKSWFQVVYWSHCKRTDWKGRTNLCSPETLSTVDLLVLRECSYSTDSLTQLLEALQQRLQATQQRCNVSIELIIGVLEPNSWQVTSLSMRDVSLESLC